MKTRTFLTLSALALGMIAATQSAQAAPASPGLTQNISNTRHNLSYERSGTGVNGGPGFGDSVGDIYTTEGAGSDQICVFCHTPHGSNKDFKAAPLWNRAVQASSVYTGYTMVGSQSKTTGTTTIGGMSLACLSCHDGTQAMDAMFNAPGSGPGAGDGLSAAAQDYVWTAGAADDTSDNHLRAPITWLDTDLSNDHPIGMFYCGGASGTTCDNDFKTGTDGSKANTATIGVLKLFSADGKVNDAKVECATCHDPHISDSNTQLFLRVTPVASAICLTCHTK